MPLRRSLCSSAKLKSGLSIPKKSCGCCLIMCCPTERRMDSSSGSRLSGSNKPKTDNRSMSCRLVSPWRAICSPPMPENDTSLCRRLSSPQYRAPQNVAAFFTGQDTDVLRLTHYRTIPRSDDFRDSSNGVISGVSAAISSNRSIAISSVRP